MRVASLVLLACVAASVAAPVPKKAPPPDYFPCTLGSKWEYAKDGEKETCLTVEVTKVEVKDGVRTVTFDQTDGANKLRDYPESYRVSGEGVHLTFGGGHECVPPRLDLRATPKAKDEWESPHEWWQWKYDLTVTVGDEEQVDVPAGKFTTLPHSQAFVVTGQKQAWKGWFAAGVGRVKFTNQDGTTYVLLKYTAGKDK